MNFQTPSEDGYPIERSTNVRRDIAAFLLKNSPSAVRALTTGNFGYSVTRPTASKDYFFDILNNSSLFNCSVEAFHTETGPGVFEAVRQ